MIAGLTAAVVATSFAFQRTSLEMLERELAFRASDSGSGFYLTKIAAQPDYFTANPAPHGSIEMEDAAFTLESAEPVGGQPVAPAPAGLRRGRLTP